MASVVKQASYGQGNYSLYGYLQVADGSVLLFPGAGMMADRIQPTP
jgi:hypothetical protein